MIRGRAASPHVVTRERAIAIVLMVTLATVLGSTALSPVSIADDGAPAVLLSPPILEALAASRAGAPWPRAPLLLDARIAAGVDAAWPRTPALGAGATICVIDTGLDLSHAAFRDPSGASRVRWLLDVDGAPGAHRSIWPEGAAYDAAAIEEALAAAEPPRWARDTHGHGTAITGAAAGDDAGIGQSAPGPYAGVAPRAELVVVRALGEGALGFEDRDVIAGARACAALVDPSRLVIVLALGGHDGAHDGTEPLELALAEIARDGAAIVVAAGNDGEVAVHAGGTVSPGARAEVTLNVPEPEPGPARVVLAIRTRGPIDVTAPDGAVTRAEPGARASAGAVTIDRIGPRASYVILAGDEATPLRGGGYTLGMRGELDVWIVDHDLGEGLDAPRLTGPFASSIESVAVPATHPRLISVGASVSRAAWASETGGDPGLMVDLDPITLRARFSALGPTAAGAPAPDLLAPGALVRTVLSGSIEPAPGALFRSDAALARARRGEGVVIAGTSIAAAIVGGSIALARAEAPSLDVEGERAALLVGAREGRLDVAGYLRAREDSALGVPDPARSTLTLSRAAARPATASVWATLVARDAEGGPATGSVRIVARGEVLAEGVLYRGVFRSPIAPLTGNVVEDVLVEAEVDGSRVAGAMLALRPDERGRSVAAGGSGCHVAHGRTTNPGLVGLALVAWLVSKRRTR